MAPGAPPYARDCTNSRRLKSWFRIVTPAISAQPRLMVRASGDSSFRRCAIMVGHGSVEDGQLALGKKGPCQQKRRKGGGGVSWKRI